MECEVKHFPCLRDLDGLLRFEVRGTEHVEIAAFSSVFAALSCNDCALASLMRILLKLTEVNQLSFLNFCPINAQIKFKHLESISVAVENTFGFKIDFSNPDMGLRLVEFVLNACFCISSICSELPL